MYNDYFGFKEAPFSIAPDPRYLYMSDQHREAFAHLLYGIQSDGGFVLFTGEVGTGKTTICRCLLEQLPEECDVAFIFNPRLSVEELLSTICDELSIPYPPGTTSNKTFVDLINRYLLEGHAAGRKTVLIIDEAQNLSVDVLEQMRLLTNLETNQRKLLQIIMLGQPELHTLLSQPELRQLEQRIVARCHLDALSKPEVAAYVQHRLAVAGCQRPLFPPAALNRLYRLSKGVPRLINVLCDRALLGVYAQGGERVDLATLVKAAREVFGANRWIGRRTWRLARNGLFGLVMLGTGALLASAYYNPKAVLLLDKVLKRPAAHETDGGAAYRKPILKQVDKQVSRQQVSKAASTATKAAARGEPSAPSMAGKAPAQGKEATEKAPSVQEEVTALGAALLQEQAPVPEKAVPKAQPEPLSKLQWPADKPFADSEDLAYQALFRQWGGSYRPATSADACRQAAAQGLACLSGQGDVNDLQRINRPALLKLVDTQGRVYYATLVALKGNTATFAVGGKTETVAVSDLAARWLGDYTLFWRMPPDYQGMLQVGAQGPVVDWLAAQLAKLQGKAPPQTAPEIFDAALTAAVEHFQVAHGLKEDGIVGPQTLIRLNNAIGRKGPRLTTTTEQKDS